jgi:regulator of protease activity HflC (stomatin/prohibitin superfamily)
MEKEKHAPSGYLALIVLLILIVLAFLSIVWLGMSRHPNGFLIFLLVVFEVICFFCLSGLVSLTPNESRVLTLFGTYKGTVKQSGFFWLNPFYFKRRITLRARNLDTQPLKVNDKVGNPILIGAVCVWKVEDTFKAAFDVDNYEHFVGIQCESAIRKLANHYPYDHFGDNTDEITLRSGGEDVNNELERELTERLTLAGIKVIEARLSHLAYASEIASAMLQRQQASAIVAARFKIVEGAVGMVEVALEMLAKKGIIEFGTEQKSILVSNLLVVLCSEKSAQPIVNTGN